MARSRKLRYGTLRYSVVAVGVAAMTVMSGCAALVGDPEPERVLVGVDLDLTGPGSSLGEVYRTALELRLEQVNEQGLLGDREIELLVRDNRSDPGTAAENLAELAADPDVAAIVTGGCDRCTLDSVEALNEAGVPTISLGSLTEIAEPTEDRPYLFQLSPPADATARVLGGELARIEAETVALVTSGDAYGEEGSQRMSDAAADAGAEPVVEATVDGDDDGVAQAASEILAYQPEPELGFPPQGQQQTDPQVGPDAVVLWAREPAASEVAVALREQDYEGEFLLGAVAADELFFTGEAGAALDGARIAFTETLVIDSVIATSPAKAARQTWFREYTAREGTYHAYSSFAADAIQVLVEAITRFDDVGRDALRDAIERVQIEGLSGPIRIRLESHSGLSPRALTTLVVQGDRWRLATT